MTAKCYTNRGRISFSNEKKENYKNDIRENKDSD